MHYKNNEVTPSVTEIMGAAMEFHQQGILDKAAESYQKVLKLQPGNTDALHLLGVIASQSGQYDLSIELIKQAISLNSAEPVYHNNLALAYYLQGNYTAAVTSCRNALKLNPYYTDALCTFANSQFQLQRFDEAVDSYLHVLKIDPADIDALYNLGNSFRELGKFDEAIQSFNKTLQLSPYHADALNNLGKILLDTGKIDEAKDAFERALQCDPELVSAKHNLAIILDMTGHYEESINYCKMVINDAPDFIAAYKLLTAIHKKKWRLEEAQSVCEQALQLNMDDPELHNNLGNIFYNMGKLEKSRLACEKAIKIDPEYADAHVNLGATYHALGDLTKAGVEYETALSLNPGLVQAYYNLSSIKKYSREDLPFVEQLKNMLSDSSLSTDEKIKIRFSLGKIYDDCKMYDDAFLHFREGNKLKRETYTLDHKHDEIRIGEYLKIFSGEFLTQYNAAGVTSELPVFIVGMLRSGTTLVEQIISSHSQAYGAGELNYIGKIADDLPGVLNTTRTYPECVSLLDHVTIKMLAKKYLNRLVEHSGKAVRITDKMPENFYHLGLIAMLFPNAHIIHCQRDPLDTCLSIYFQLFENPNLYAYDLEDIGFWYQQYLRLMSHWTKILPVKLLTVQYEDLVSDQEKISRKIIEFIGLDWEERCLQFHDTDRAVQTTSIWQVRQPIYKTSRARWKHYDKFIGPLKNTLNNVY